MDISKNKLKEIPEVVFDTCFNLIELNASNNYIEKLPDSISKLTNLQTLNVSSNGLSYASQLKQNAKLK